MNSQEKIEFLKSKGWFTWYNENYWCHEKVVRDPQIQDCRQYGMSLNKAYLFETENKKPIPPVMLVVEKLLDYLRRNKL